jgi:response regulator NasT
MDLIEQAVEHGVAAYLIKPFEQSKLLPAIHVAVSHFRELQALRAENTSLKETVEASRLVTRAKLLLAERENLSEAPYSDSISAAMRAAVPATWVHLSV